MLGQPVVALQAGTENDLTGYTYGRFQYRTEPVIQIDVTYLVLSSSSLATRSRQEWTAL